MLKPQDMTTQHFALTARIRAMHPDAQAFETKFLPVFSSSLAAHSGVAEVQVAHAVLKIMDLYAAERHIGIHKAMAFELALSTLLPESGLEDLAAVSSDVVRFDELRALVCFDPTKLSQPASPSAPCSITAIARTILAAARVMSQVHDHHLMHVEKGALLATSRDSLKFMVFTNARLGQARAHMGDIGIPEDDANAIKRILKVVESHLPRVSLFDPEAAARRLALFESAAA
jgi:hypothetical protein